MRRFSTLCAILAIVSAACETTISGPDAVGGPSDATGGGARADVERPEECDSLDDAGGGLPTCADVTARPLAACVVEAGTVSGDPEFVPEGVTHDVAGVVVETGAGAPPDDCLHRAPGYNAYHGANPEDVAPARWFRVTDLAGVTWTVWLMLGEHTPALAPGEAVVVRAFYRLEPFAPSPGHVTVSRPAGELIAWFGTDGTAEALAPPDGVTLARGPAVCAQSNECGAWEGHELAVTAGAASGTVPYGATATVGGLRVVHGGLRHQTTTETQCMDWFVADAAAALVPLPPALVADEPRPREPWPGPCEKVKRDPDGTPFESWRYEYDAAGRVALEEWDGDADGAPEQRVRWTYDEAGHLTVIATEGLNGEIGTDRNVYVYEGDLLVREEHEDAAGVVDIRRTYTYDGDRLVRKDHDSGADGTVEVRWTWRYDEAGRRVREERDEGADGTADARTDWSYDAEGRLAEERHDEFVDGRLEDRQTHTWYGAGHAIRREHDELVWEYCPDESRNWSGACPGDGVVDQRALLVYDAAERPRLILVDGGLAAGPPDGVADGRDEWAYDTAGRRTRHDERDAAGALRASTEWVYDAHGDLAEVRHRAADGPWTSTASVRDEAGNLLSEADGLVTYAYDCWE